MEKDTTLPLSPAAPQHFGKLLQDARERKGISLDDVAKETFILKRHLQAIEAEDFTAMPERAFARGFVVNYAKFLGLDVGELGQSFDSHYPVHLQPKSTAELRSPMQPIGTLQRESRGKIKLNPFLILGLLAALGLGVFIFKTVNKAHSDNQAQTTEKTGKITTVTPQDQATGASLSNAGSALGSSGSSIGNAGSAINNANNVNTANTVAATNAANANALGSSGSAVESVMPASSNATSSVTTTAPSVAPVDMNAANTTTAVNSATGNTAGSLELWVKDNTAVNVTDATGKVLIEGEKTRGAYNLSGQPPFNVKIDKVSNVNMVFNKNPIKLAQYAQNNQANFTLKP